ncbi:hypothetical protein [Hugenholtzia roseola]|uniref:hypothetical protein n=1 Tax=Hugenholtzia roseola TaxID=1002 RepID=UPI0004795434|nr:hypothetical protein [Hugenholtzia roseola]
MKALRLSLLLMTLFSVLFLTKCSCSEDDPKPEPQKTLVELISKQWKIRTLTVDGQGVTDNIANFRLTLNSDGPNPTTYGINLGGLAYNFAPATSGNWTVNDAGTQMTFSGQTVQAQASEENIRITYTVPEEQDKNTPTVVFDLIPNE